jgi:spore germination protein YaaH
MGVPYYGYNWIVTTTDQNAVRIPGNDLIGTSQSQPYQNVMDTILETKPQINWDELAQSPYFTYTSPATGMTRQVYFENEQSLKAKYELVKKYDLAGVGIWALGYDGGYQELWNLLKEEFVTQ